MSHNDLGKFDVLLMIDQATDTLFPFSSHGFHWAQERYNLLVQQSSNWLVLDDKGDLYAIKKVHLCNTSFAAKLKRLAGFAYQIKTDLEPYQIELSALKQLILAGMGDYKSRVAEDDSWAFFALTFSEIESFVLDSPDAKSLYEILALPNAVDCLDLL